MKQFMQNCKSGFFPIGKNPNKTKAKKTQQQKPTPRVWPGNIKLAK